MPTPRASADRHSLAATRKNLSATHQHTRTGSLPVMPPHAPIPMNHKKQLRCLSSLSPSSLGGPSTQSGRYSPLTIQRFRSALPRRLYPPETLNRSRFPKLRSGHSSPAVTPLSERRTNLTDTPAGVNKKDRQPDAIDDCDDNSQDETQAMPSNKLRRPGKACRHASKSAPRRECPRGKRLQKQRKLPQPEPVMSPAPQTTMKK
jgi:hypothetical protein